MGNKELQKKMTSLVHEQLKEENATTRALVNILIAQVSSRRNSSNPSQAIRNKLDDEIQKMIDNGTIEDLDDEY